MEHNLPVIVVKGSAMCNAMIDHMNGKNKMHNEVFEKLLEEGHFYALESGKSEDLAAFAHFFLTVTPYGHVKREWKEDGVKKEEGGKKKEEEEKEKKRKEEEKKKKEEEKKKEEDEKKKKGSTKS